MVGLIIASHGEFCEGLKKTAEMFTGPIAQCMALPLQPGMTGEAYDVILEEAIDALDEGQGVVVMTDLKGGTPFNRCAGMVFRGKRIRVLTGMNLPMVMSVGCWIGIYRWRRLQRKLWKRLHPASQRLIRIRGF